MAGLWRGTSGLWGGASGLWRSISGLWSGASGLVAGGGAPPPPPLVGFSQTYNPAPQLVYDEDDRLVVRTDAVGQRAVRSNTSHATGKWYAELRAVGDNLRFAGVVDSTYDTAGGGGLPGVNRCGIRANNYVGYPDIDTPAGGFATVLVILHIAYDADSDQYWFKRGPDNWNNDPLADPVTGVGGISTAGLVGPAYLGATLLPTVGAGVRYRIPGDPGYSLPSGFLEWSS